MSEFRYLIDEDTSPAMEHWGNGELEHWGKVLTPQCGTVHLSVKSLVVVY